MRILTPLVFAFGLAVAACVPLRFDYYAPQAPAGKLGFLHGECNDVKHVIAFGSPESGVNIRLYARPSTTGISLTVSIIKTSSYDKDSAVDFATNRIAVTGAGNPQTLTLKLPGEGTHLVLTPKKDWFDQYFQLPDAVDSFGVEMPAARIDGVAVDIPRVYFTRRSDVVMTGINC